MKRRNIRIKKLLVVSLIFSQISGSISMPVYAAAAKTAEQTVLEAPVQEAEVRETEMPGTAADAEPGDTGESVDAEPETDTVLQNENRMEVVVNGTTEIISGDIYFEENADGTLAVCGYGGTETVLNIPESVEERTVTGINFLEEKGEGSLSNIKKIYIPKTITFLNSVFDVFSNLDGLEEFDVAADNTCYQSVNGVLYTKAGDSLIKYPESYAAIEFTVPDSVGRLEHSAFYGNKNLTRIILPDELHYIGMNCFSSCAKLEAVEVEYGTMEDYAECAEYNEEAKMDMYAFSECALLKTLDIPNGIHQIGMFVLGETSPESITIMPNTRAFPQVDVGVGAAETIYGYQGTKADYIAAEWGTKFESLGLITNYVFSYTDIGDNKIRIEGIHFYQADELIIPETIDGKTVTEIGKAGNDTYSGVVSSFVSCNHLVIPNTLEQIGSYAFSSAYGLKKVTIQSKTIGESAFLNCIGLTEVLLEGVITIGHDAFSGCESIKEIVIPDSVTVIGESAFSYCIGLETIKISAGLKELTFNVFKGCSRLKVLELPEGLEKCYIACEGLESIVIPKSLYYFHIDGAICTNLKEITIPAEVLTIEGLLPAGCKIVGYSGSVAQRAAVEAGITFEAVGDIVDVSAFEWGEIDEDGSVVICQYTGTDKMIMIPAKIGTRKVTGIGLWNGGGSSSADVESIVIEEGISSISAGAFSLYKELSEITIPKSVTSIGEDAIWFNPNFSKEFTMYGYTGSAAEAFYNKLKAAYPESDYPAISISFVSLGNMPELEHRITYELNGGINHANNPAAFVETKELELFEPTRQGHTFSGWYTDENFKTKITKIPKGRKTDITLYAKWTANQFEVAFYKNNTKATGTMKVQKLAYESNTALTKNAFRLKGYDFTGWNTAEDGSGIYYADGADGSRITHVAGEKIKLYAQWEIAEYAIAYELNGGSIAEGSNPVSYFVTSDKITLHNPVREGYTFAGWYSDAKYKTKVTTIKKGSTGDKTLYAKWTAYKYTIVYNKNGATSGRTPTTTYQYGTAYSLKANGYKKPGYAFTGWNTAADGSGTAYADKQSIQSLTKENGAKITLYAQWEPLL